jgi:autotransporter-associated beta strand protein
VARFFWYSRTLRTARRAENRRLLQCEQLESRFAPATLHWLGSAAANGNLWGVAGNWAENRIPATGDQLIFDSSQAGFSATSNGFNPINNITNLANIRLSIVDDSPLGDFSIGGNVMSIAVSGIDCNVTVGANATASMNLNLPGPTTFKANSGTLVLGGILAGSGSVVAEGSGSVVLDGPNTYSGSTIVNSGTLRVSPGIPRQGLIGRYSFDGNTNDTARGNHGVISASGASYVAGRMGQALRLTGSQSVQIPFSNAYVVNSFTTSAWIKVDGPGSDFPIMHVDGSQTFEMAVSGNLNALRITVGNESTWYSAGLGAIQVVSPGDWHMVTCSVDGSSRVASLYFDGVLAATHSLLDMPIFMRAGRTLLIGETFWRQFFTGAIDEATIYSRALSPSEVQGLYLGEGGSSIPSLSAVTVASGATLDLAGNATTIGSLSGSGTVLSSVPGPVTLAIGANNRTASFSGAIQDGVGQLSVEKVGIGTQSLIGPNSYTGTTTRIAGVLNCSPQIRSANSASFPEGFPASFQLSASGFPNPTYSVAGTLPAGVTLDPSGLLSGTPVAGTAGTYPLTITASNGFGFDAVQSFTLRVGLTITSANTAAFTVGALGAFNVTAPAAPAAAFTFVGALPAGLTFGPNGVISGTPAANTAGTYPLTVSATSGGGPPITQEFLLAVNEAPTLTSTAATFRFGQANRFQLTATGFPAAKFHMSDGFPTEIVLSPDGSLTGTPTHVGVFQTVITAFNGIGAISRLPFTLRIEQVPKIVSPSSKVFGEGATGNFQIVAEGFPNPTFSISGSLPAGVTFTSGGLLQGTPGPGAAGTYPLIITANNGVGSPTTQSFTLTVVGKPVFTSPASTTFFAGTAGSFTSVATGSPTPTYSMTGTLPSGVTFSSTGVLSGTPSATSGGAYPITIVANNGIAAASSQSFVLNVNQPPTITSPSTVTIAVNRTSTFRFTTTGFPAPTFSVVGALPNGIALSADGVLSGLPTITGTFPISVTASNGVNPSATQAFVLNVVQPAPIITSPATGTFTVGQGGSFTFTATGIPKPTFSLIGTLPNNMTFNPLGSLIGGPLLHAGGVYPLIIRATNSVGSFDQEFSLIINQSPLISSDPYVSFVRGQFRTFALTSSAYPAPTYTVTGGLPNGLSFDPTTGIISGAPASDAVGNYPLVVRASNGIGDPVTQQLMLSVKPFAFTGPSYTAFSVEEFGAFQFSTTNNLPTTFEVAGRLPSGVTLSSAGLLSGTPAAGTGGTYYVTVVASDGASTMRQPFALTVNTPDGVRTLAANYYDDGSIATQVGLSLYPPNNFGGERKGGIVVDPFGNFYFSDPGHSRVRKVAVDGTITTIAGNGDFKFGGDNGLASEASLYIPSGLSIDAAGNLYIADQANHRIRKVDANGIITTVAGNGQTTHNGDGIPATAAAIDSPNSVAVDSLGNLLISGGGYIRKVSPAGIISTVAGNGLSNFGGDGGLAQNAGLSYPRGIIVDPHGNIYFADGPRVRKIDTSGIITTFAGGGSVFRDGMPATSAQIGDAYDVRFDAAGNLLILTSRGLYQVTPGGTITMLVRGSSFSNDVADGGPVYNAELGDATALAINSGNVFLYEGTGHRIRRIDVNGIIDTVAGNGTRSSNSGYSGDGGDAATAQMRKPLGIARDAVGNLFIADNGNHVIRKISTDGKISTIAGNGIRGTSGDGGPALAASLSFPSSIVVDASGNLYFIESGNRVRKVAANGTISTFAGNGTSNFNGDGILATAAGMVPSDLALDSAGNLLICDRNNRIRRVNATTGIISTVAGNGSRSVLNQPSSVSVDAAGNLYINSFTPSGQWIVLKQTPGGTLSTVAGRDSTSSFPDGDGGSATDAIITAGHLLRSDAAGNVYIVENLDSDRIRRVDAATGFITSIANNYSAPSRFGGDGKPAALTLIESIGSMTLDSAGNIYLTQSDSGRIQRIPAVSRPNIVATSPPVATVGVPFSYRFEVKGSPPPKLVLNGLPSWASFDPSSGLLTGTPTAPGSFPLVLKANNFISVGPSRAFSLVVKIAPTLTWSNPADIVYGTALSSLQLNAAANVPGTFVYNRPLGTVLHAGQLQPITVTFTPNDPNTYHVVQKTVFINVSPARLTIRANNITVSGSYSFIPPPTATYLGLVDDDTPASIAGVQLTIQTVPTTLPTSPIRIPPRTPARFTPGTYTIVVSGGFSTDYVITYVTGVLVVL